MKLRTFYIMKSRVNIYNSSTIPVKDSFLQSFTLSSWWMWIKVKWGMAINITDLRLSWWLLLIWDVMPCSLLPSCQHSGWIFFKTIIVLLPVLSCTLLLSRVGLHRPWRRRRCVAPKCDETPTTQHSDTSHQTALRYYQVFLSLMIAVIPFFPTNYIILCCYLSALILQTTPAAINDT